MRVGVPVVVVCMLVGSAHAAELTRVASSFEDNDPFGMFLNFTFDRTSDRAKITREWYQNGNTQDVYELFHTKVDTRMGIDVHLGIYKDLEFHAGLPIVFQQDRAWRFGQGSGADVSTIYRNCGDSRGNVCSTPGLGTDRLFEIGPDGTASYRGGLGDLTLGLAWAPFVQAKDDTKPTWTVRFDYTAPISAVLDPTVPTSSANRGTIGDRIHRYKFATSVSKRLGAIEPYFELHYTLPWRGPGYYSNCNSGLNMGRAENCGVQGWTREETGIHPPHVGGFIFGTEITLFDRPERHQRVAFDLRGFGDYTSEGRYYNELSDLMGKLLYTSDYGTIGGHVGFIGQAAEFVLLRAYAIFSYNTEHFLTNENIGKDWSGNGTVDITDHPDEINPNYDFRVDRVGRRFRVTESWQFRIIVTANFNF